MCRPTPCSSCGKTTWAGCGRYVEAVKATVPAGQWCTCDRNTPSHPAKDGAGLFSTLFG